MIVDSHPPVPTGAVFDPATLMRNKPPPGGAVNGQMTAAQQQQARQQYWSGLAKNRQPSGQDAANQNNGSKSNSKMPPHQQWTTPAEKEIYTPFKSVSGRVTPLDDLYASNNRPMSAATNEYMPAPQDPRDRPPSRANGMMTGQGYHRRPERKSEGSVVYQPLTPTNHASAWSNSLMFNKPYDPFDHPGEMPLGASAGIPPLPHIQTLPRQLPLARNGGFGGPPPDEPTHNGRQQIPQQQPFITANGYVPLGGPGPDMHQHPSKMDQSKSGNRVTVVPGGTIINTPSLSSAEMVTGDMTDGDEGDEKTKKSKTRRRLSRQRGRNLEAQPKDAMHSHLRVAEKFAILHILLGVCLFAVGIARLLMLSIWGLGIELVYGVYVVLTGTLGVIGCRRRHFCSLAACYVMSALSCLLGIPPFVTGLLVTIPNSFPTVDPKLFASTKELFGVDIFLSVVCLLEIVVSVIICGLGCSVIGRAMNKWRQTEGINMATHGHTQSTGAQNGNGHGNGGGKAGGNNQGPIFHTSVNITHPSMMK